MSYLTNNTKYLSDSDSDFDSEISLTESDSDCESDLDSPKKNSELINELSSKIKKLDMRLNIRKRIVNNLTEENSMSKRQLELLHKQDKTYLTNNHDLIEHVKKKISKTAKLIDLKNKYSKEYEKEKDTNLKLLETIKSKTLDFVEEIAEKKIQKIVKVPIKSQNFHILTKQVEDINFTSWSSIFEKVDNEIFQLIKQTLKKDSYDGVNIYPPPKYIFNAFRQTNFNDVKVVILGQCPTRNSDDIGLAFCIKDGELCSPSTSNIFKNMKKYKHIDNPIVPNNSNLQYLTSQGCLLLNMELTVTDAGPGSHYHIWHKFTDTILKELISKKDYLIFVAWGSKSIGKLFPLIVDTNHDIIAASHPSGLSSNKEVILHNTAYPAFDNYDHFKTINELLKHNGETPLDLRIN